MFKTVALRGHSDAEIAELLDRLGARFQPLQSLATSGEYTGTLVGGDPVGVGGTDQALRLWATHPHEDDGGMTFGRPLVWWDGTPSQALGVVLLNRDVRQWVLVMRLQRDANGRWSEMPGTSGAFCVPTYGPEADTVPLESVPHEWIAEAMSRDGTSAFRAVEHYAGTMYRLAFAPLTDDDGSFGAAWCAWSRDGRGRGKSRTDREYVALAVRYMALVRTRHAAPTETLARLIGKSPIAVRKALGKARAGGVFTEATNGRAGGSLTDDGLLVFMGMLADDGLI